MVQNDEGTKGIETNCKGFPMFKIINHIDVLTDAGLIKLFYMLGLQCLCVLATSHLLITLSYGDSILEICDFSYLPLLRLLLTQHTTVIMITRSRTAPPAPAPYMFFIDIELESTLK